MTCALHSLLLSAIIIICYCMRGPYNSVACQKKASCHVQDGRADCSHLSLTAVPSDLPRNITSLDMSHNQLRGIPPVSLALYPGLIHLDISYNVLKKLDIGLCKTLRLLQTLIIEHNQVLYLTKEDLSHCTNLLQLSMASNRLRFQGEPFSVLQVQMTVIQSWIFHG